jgi:ABC-type thiamin/hydroxymethylpyrimidine transport system permease subunit
MTINGFGQVFLNGTHTPHLLYGVAGLGADLAFGLFYYKRYDLPTVCLAGIACSLFWYPVVYFSHTVYLYPTQFILIDLVVRVLGSTVGDGILGASLGFATLWILHRVLTGHPRLTNEPVGLTDTNESSSSLRESNN